MRRCPECGQRLPGECGHPRPPVGLEHPQDILDEHGVSFVDAVTAVVVIVAAVVVFIMFRVGII